MPRRLDKGFLLVCDQLSARSARQSARGKTIWAADPSRSAFTSQFPDYVGQELLLLDLTGRRRPPTIPAPVWQWLQENGYVERP